MSASRLDSGYSKDEMEITVQLHQIHWNNQILNTALLCCIPTKAEVD